MARTKRNWFDFSDILFLRCAMMFSDGTPFTEIAKKHDEYIKEHKIGIATVSEIGNGHSRVNRTCNRMRKVGLFHQRRAMQLNVLRVQKFWQDYDVDMDDWRTWALQLPFDETGTWFDFSNMGKG